ncbi:LytTR family DNA-binding domain-containing protein [Bacillus sp. CECT 9360]|uniref:LytR/AlgR family response regulator transcription factor n=1 Tax=Bacillus sp. CECT 9360 TaxID=2845821 RepID=UPI001E50D178|nr:LytTR family DNA-binding domain-containing protein [Bacillus sp. CECT 9360]CAH0346429.1 Transcriptional regulatory protein BtsR [Bacillus sp. CECT 9360]
MKQLRIIIADDDDTSRSLLRHFLEMDSNLLIIGEASTGDELVQKVMDKKPDLALVDINMPGLTGLEAVRTCKEILPFLYVIFTTGYDEFAVEAFNLSAIDYLVKPIERSRLYIALEKAKKVMNSNIDTEKTVSNEAVKKLSLKTSNSYLYLPMKDILFIEKAGRKTIIHTQTDCYEINEALQVLENKLDSYFYKTHRSFIVNLKHIIKIESMGESYIAYFSDSLKSAQISKLKINEVQKIISNVLD